MSVSARTVQALVVVMAFGVTAVFGGGVAQAAPTAVGSGTSIVVNDTAVTAAACTLGAVLSPRRAVTAGHCGAVGRSVYTPNGVRIGRITANLLRRHVDLAVIALAPGVRARVDAVNFAPRFARGQRVSKLGARSGYSAGPITNPVLRDQVARGFVLRPPFLEVQTTRTINARLHAVAGDSGAGVRSAGRIVGIVSSVTDDGSAQFAPLSLLSPTLR